MDTEGMQIPASVYKIVQYELGRLDQDQTIELFQELLDRGMIPNLQGHYGRTAESLLDAGLIEHSNRA